MNKSKSAASDVSWSRAPGLFAILMSINVASYVLCTPMMVKVLEAKETSVFSMLLMLAFTVIGARVGDRLCVNCPKWLGVLIGAVLAGVGIGICTADAFDALCVPGPKLMATATGDSVFFIMTYIISDVFSDVFGYKASRLSGNVSAIFAITVGLVGKLLTFVPVPEYAEANEAAFDFIYGGGIYVAIVGVLIYAVGDWFNDRMFRWIKSKKSGTDYGSYSLRAIGSSLLGKTMDLLLFTGLVMVPFSTPSLCDKLGIECWGMDAKSLAGNFLLGVTLQITLECLFSPVSYIISKSVRKRLNDDKLSLNA